MRAVNPALNKIRAALLNRNATIMCVGDSFTEGYQATNFIDNRWVAKLVSGLQTTYMGAAGGLGYANIYSTVVPGGGSTSGSAYWTKAHNTLVNETGTFGYRTYTPDTNEVLTFNYTGTSIKLHYRQGTASNVPFTVNVDSGGAVTVTPSTTGGANNQGTYSTPVLSHGAHSAVITPQASGIAYIKGAFVYDGDETTGIRIWDNAQYGYTSTNFLSLFCDTPSLTDTMSTNLCANPDLVIVMGGLNDGNAGIGTTTFQTNLQSIITNIKSFCTNSPSFLLVGEYNAPSLYGGDQSAYYATMQTVAMYDSANVTYMSLLGQMITGDISGDNLHPSNQGYAHIASLIQQFLAPASSFNQVGLRPHLFSPGNAR